MLIRRQLVMIGLPLVIGGLVAATPVFAQATTDSNAAPPPTAPDASQHWGRQHDPVAHVQKRLDKLKAALAITAGQEPQWSAFSDQVLTQVREVQAEHEAMKARPVTAPERIDWQIARMKDRTARFEVVAQAAKDLYASLTPEQKQIADKKLLNFHHRHRG